MNEDYKLHILLTNTNKFNSEVQAHDFLHYLNILLSKNNNKKISLLLDCFNEYHKSSCLKDNCPAKKIYIKTKQLAKIFPDESEDANRIQLLYVIETIYVQAIEKFFHLFILICK